MKKYTYDELANMLIELQQEKIDKNNDLSNYITFPLKHDIDLEHVNELYTKQINLFTIDEIKHLISLLKISNRHWDLKTQLMKKLLCLLESFENLLKRK